MTVNEDANKGFVITDITGLKRKWLRALVIRSRLKFATRPGGRTDSYALLSARDLADIKFRTMNQALTWIEKWLEDNRPEMERLYGKGAVDGQ